MGLTEIQKNSFEESLKNSKSISFYPCSKVEIENKK